MDCSNPLAEPEILTPRAWAYVAKLLGATLSLEKGIQAAEG